MPTRSWAPVTVEGLGLGFEGFRLWIDCLGCRVYNYTRSSWGKLQIMEARELSSPTINRDLW